jgi:hypothetical protein
MVCLWTGSWRLASDNEAYVSDLSERHVSIPVELKPLGYIGIRYHEIIRLFVEVKKWGKPPAQGSF